MAYTQIVPVNVLADYGHGCCMGGWGMWGFGPLGWLIMILLTVVIVAIAVGVILYVFRLLWSASPAKAQTGAAQGCTK